MLGVLDVLGVLSLLDLPRSSRVEQRAQLGLGVGRGQAVRGLLRLLRLVLGLLLRLLGLVLRLQSAQGDPGGLQAEVRLQAQGRPARWGSQVQLCEHTAEQTG